MPQTLERELPTTKRMEGIAERLLFAEESKISDGVMPEITSKRKRGRPRKVIRDPTMFHFKCKHKPFALANYEV